MKVEDRVDLENFKKAAWPLTGTKQDYDPPLDRIGDSNFCAARRSLTRYFRVLPAAGRDYQRSIDVPVGKNTLHGDLSIPKNTGEIVVFAHGTGSSRHSPRNKFVAEVLNNGGLATLLVDLLTPSEEAIDMQTAHIRFDIPLLAERLAGVTDWLGRNSETAKLRVGYFGASTGATAALVAAAKRQDIVKAVVSRGGRPDLAGTWLRFVRASTLLIVGGDDWQVIHLNRQAAGMLKTHYRMVIIPGAGHLFEEPGMLEKVALLAYEWFEGHLIQRTKAA
jgi:putative phosphoribosyl transferase